LSSPADPQTVEALSELLSAKGIEISGFIDVINALDKIKEGSPAKTEDTSLDAPKKKHYIDKEFIFETRRDVFIYRSGSTKSRRYYIRIYDEKAKKDYVQSLRTTNRIEALAKAEEIYAERKNALRRGVRPNSINTKELIRIYTTERLKTLTSIPHQGITKDSFSTLSKQLKYWHEYISHKGHTKTSIDAIPPDIGKGFGIWLKELPKDRYQDRERSNETINHAITAVKKMYRDIAIDERYITMAEFPIFRLLKVNREKSHKRDIIEPEEFLMLGKWMENTWRKDQDASELERAKRYIYCQYLAINYLTGCRNKEMLGIRWGDIATIKQEDKESQKINRSIFISAQNSKTGKSRHCVAPVAHQFERIKEQYRRLGIATFDRNDYVFINLSKTKRGTNIPYDQPAMEKRLKAVIEQSGLKQILDETGRHITQYSARHYAVTDALMRGVSIYDIAVNTGTSVHYIEQTYSKVTALKKSQEITKGQGLHKVIEQRAVANSKAYEATGDGNIYVDGREFNEDPNYIKLHYKHYYAGLSPRLQRIDDFSWLSVMEGDPRVPRRQVEDERRRLVEKWGIEPKEMEEELNKCHEQTRELWEQFKMKKESEKNQTSTDTANIEL
jgi:integrase